ncbi:MAG: chitobiase/beta-hexosaminidase C-terminal domain-containing protein, partial [Verrucomicrobiota bacterium]
INLGAASARLNAGANLLAIHALNITATNTTFLFKATLAINDLPSIALLGPGESWKYLPGVVEPSGGLYDPALLFAGKLNVSWGSPTSYDDSAWGSGPGPLGAGPASGAATLVPGVIDQTPSLYARAIFNVTEAQRTDNQPLRLLVDYDDSFIAYLNGVEVARANLGAAPNTFTPAAAVANGSRNKTGVQTTFLIDPPSRLLKEGPNVLAFQVHNVSIKDSDLYLKADLHTSAGEALVVNTQTWKYLAGTAEPVTTEDDGTEESPSGPDYAGDWIELQNTHQTEAVLLSGWQLSDEPGNPNKWVFPDGVSIAPGGYLVVFCDGLNSDLRAAGGFLHANFKLSEKGDYLALRNRSGLLVHDFSPAYPRGSAFHSYGVNAAGQMRFFDKATPGAANAGMEFEGIINDPAFSLPEGFYTGPQSLVLSCATPGASIRYTVNGSEPTQATGTLYSGAISVTGTMAIRARAFKEGMIASRTASKTYLVNQPVSRRSLPAICLTADPDRSLFRPFGIFSITNNNTASNYISDIWHAANSPAQYNNANLRGPFIERPGNLQLLYPDGRRGFNIDCGLRTAGSPYSRPRYVFPWLNTANPNSVSPYPSSPVEKPQINAFFRDEIGGEPLEFPLFPGSAVTSFDSLRLRSGKNDISNPFVRDELTRRLFIDTGNVGVHGINTTLWVNGIYKGYYNPVERPRQTFFQNWFGSSKEWDVWVINDAAEGDNLMLQELLSYVRNHPQNSYANFQGTMARLDVANFIDCLTIITSWPVNVPRTPNGSSPSGTAKAPLAVSPDQALRQHEPTSSPSPAPTAQPIISSFPPVRRRRAFSILSAPSIPLSVSAPSSKCSSPTGSRSISFREAR